MMDKKQLRDIGRRPNVMQIVPPLSAVRPAYLREEESQDDDLVTRPLDSPTGPGGAAGFHNVAGSQLAVPEITNIYMGTFWGDQNFIEGFSKAIVENGYLDPLAQLKYGTGPGRYLGPVNGIPLSSGTTFAESDAQAAVQDMITSGLIQPNVNSLFVLILPDGVTSTLGSDQSCQNYCSLIVFRAWFVR